MSDLVRCLNCESGPFTIDEVRTTYNVNEEAYDEQCPICSASHALAWFDEEDLTSN